MARIISGKGLGKEVDFEPVASMGKPAAMLMAEEHELDVASEGKFLVLER